MGLNKIIKQKQLDIDKLSSAVLFDDNSIENKEKDISIKKIVNPRYMCRVCEYPDVYCEGIIEGKYYYLCYNCGNEPTHKSLGDPVNNV